MSCSNFPVDTKIMGCPERVIWLLFLAGFVLCLASGSALGQPIPIRVFNDSECPSTPWPTKQFKVIHRTTPFDPFEWIENGIQDSLLNAELQEDLARADEAWGRLIEEQLTDIATRLEAAGLGCPNMPSYWINGEKKYLVYLIEMDDDWYHGWSGKGGLASSRSSVMPYMLINRDQYNRAVNAHVARVYSVLAHELFHMIQGAYTLKYGSLGKLPGNLPQRLVGYPAVIEGSASGVASYLVAQRYPDFFYNFEFKREKLGGLDYTRNYFLGLKPHDEIVGVATDVWAVSPYSTSSFWHYIIERYGGLSVMDYMLRQPLKGISLDTRTRWVETGISEPLYKAFPQFITQLASYGWSRYHGVSSEGWLNWVLDGCRKDKSDTKVGPPVEITLEADDDLRSVHELAPITAECTSVSWKIEEPALNESVIALQVEIVGPSKEIMKQVHVGLAHATFPEGNCWERLAPLTVQERRRTQCTLTPDGRLMQIGDKWVQTWTLEPRDYGSDGEAFFTITNVARESISTVMAKGLGIRFRFLQEFARMNTSQGSNGGPTATEIDSPIALDLKKIKGHVTHDRNFRDYDKACTMVLGMGDDDRTGISLSMTHDGPIVPGSYNIKPPASKVRRLPQEVPGGFLMGVSLGPNHPLSSEGKLQSDFIGQAGTVEIDSVTSGMVRGRVRAILERCRTCMALGKKPFGLSNLAVQAEFAILVSDPEFRYAHGSDRYGSHCLSFATTDDSAARTGSGRGKGEGGASTPGAGPASDGGSDSGEQKPPGVGAPVPDPAMAGSGTEGDAQTETEGSGETTANGSTTPGSLPTEGKALLLSVTGDVEKAVKLVGDSLKSTGGCTGNNLLSLGFHSGSLDSPDWFSFGFDTVGTVSTGATGVFPLREVRWDNGMKNHTIPGGMVVRVPDRFSGAGSLTIDLHKASVAQRRMMGTVVADVTNIEGQSAKLSAHYGIDLSCGVTN